jgi:hypothetical protein
MRRYWMLRGAKFLLWVVAAAAVLGLLVMGLWNWLAPALFGWPAIGFGQALALLVLSRILVGGFRRGWGHGHYWRHRMHERWERMTPEEREKFRAGFRGHCGAMPREAASETAGSQV